MIGCTDHPDQVAIVFPILVVVAEPSHCDPVRIDVYWSRGPRTHHIGDDAAGVMSLAAEHEATVHRQRQSDLDDGPSITYVYTNDEGFSRSVRL